MAVTVQARLNFGNFGTKAVSKPAKKVAKKAPAPVKKAVTQVKKAGTQVKKAASSLGGGTRGGGVGYRKFDGDALWLPNTQRPEWLDGSLPGASRAAVCAARAALFCVRRRCAYNLA
jgi:hypothetical protein